MANAADQRGPGRADPVRAALDQAVQVTAEGAGSTQRRAQDLADELSGVVGRVRDVLTEARPVTATDLDAVRRELSALSARVAELEQAAAVDGRRVPPARGGARTRGEGPQRTAGPPPRPPAPASPAEPGGSGSAASKVPAARAAAAARRQAARRKP